MALKLSVGFQKKLGTPDYGSVAAHCHVEFDVDPSLLDCNLDGFHEKAKRAFAACQQAVNDQLARQNAGTKNGNGHSDGHPPPANGNGLGGNGNGHSGNSTRLATQSQARAIRAIASKQRVDLPKLLEARFGVARPENLRLSDASSLIDELKNPDGDGR
jgi:hypothetical protein